jgi:ribosome biogenesis GTPase / thiamine phosphate phosphatase
LKSVSHLHVPDQNAEITGESRQSLSPEAETGSDQIPSAALRPGVVVRVDRATAVVEDPGGAAEPVRATWGGALLAAIAEDVEAAPTTGDHVGLRFWPDGRITVDAVGPRRTLLTRADADGGSRRQVLAANVDTVAVVEALVPDPDLRRIARLLTLAWASGAEPVILLTKADLAPDGADLAAQLRLSSACPVHEVSVVTGAGIAEVRELLAGERVVALLGASGVGKSSLLNALAGDPVMRVQELRKDGKGRHTTVTRELHRVAGGFVIDGPGLRGVGITGGQGLDLTFSDVLGFAAGCRFSDCGHQSEPGCAVLEAVDSGELEQDRIDAWRQLVAEGFRQEVRRDARLRAEERRKQKVFHKAARRSYRGQPHREGF